jgi:hypothetical protein
MAVHTIFGLGSTILQSNVAGTFTSRMFYVEPTEFGVLNPDGSMTFFLGSGFVFDAVTGNLTAGTVTKMTHFSSAGVRDHE